MTTKQERLKEVYDHLRAYHGIHTQVDFAEAVRITRPALSSAMNGNEAYLTKNLFQKICAAYPGVFDLDYLLTGKGTLLQVEEQKPARSAADEQQDVMMELYARMIRGVDDLRMQLKEELENVREIAEHLTQARNDFRDATYRLTQLLRGDSTNSTISVAAET